MFWLVSPKPFTGDHDMNDEIPSPWEALGAGALHDLFVMI